MIDLLVPGECVCCHRPGGTWCGRCLNALGQLAFVPGPAAVAPAACRSVDLETHAWGPYLDPVRTGISQWKDADRRDAAAMLGHLLAGAVVAAVRHAGWTGVPVVLIGVPSSTTARRRRGDAPLDDVARRAAERAATECPELVGPVPALRHVRRVADQARLRRGRRGDNLRGSMQVRQRWTPVVSGRRCLVVDDVVTSGSTLREAARALRVAGAREVASATIAATLLRFPTSGSGKGSTAGSTLGSPAGSTM